MEFQCLLNTQYTEYGRICYWNHLYVGGVGGGGGAAGAGGAGGAGAGAGVGAGLQDEVIMLGVGFQVVFGICPFCRSSAGIHFMNTQSHLFSKKLLHIIIYGSSNSRRGHDGIIVVVVVVDGSRRRDHMGKNIMNKFKKEEEKLVLLSIFI